MTKKKINPITSTVREICDFLSRLQQGDYTQTLVKPTEPGQLDSIIDQLNELSLSQAAARKRAVAIQEQHTVLESRLRRCLSAVKMGSWELDIATQSLVWDQSMFELYDVDPLKFSKNYGDWQAAVHPEDRQRTHHEVMAALASGVEKFTLQFRIILQNKEIRHLEALCSIQRDQAGMPVKLIGLTFDATARKRVESQLQDSQSLLSKAFSKSPLLMSVSDVATGKYLEVNDTFCRVSGYSRAELIGKTSIETGWISNEERARLLSILRAQGQVSGVDIHVQTKSGEKLIGKYWGEVIETAEGPKLFSVSEDVTEHKRLERELVEAKSAAEMANHSKDIFLATLSHELRSPLTAILSWSQLLERGVLPPEKSRVAVRTIKESAQAQSQLINDLLDVSRIVTGKLVVDQQPTNVLEVLIAAVETIRPNAELKSIAIEQSFESTHLYIFADPTRLKQVFWNLLSNAVKFTPCGGKISVVLECVQTLVGKGVLLTIKDTGKGIRPEFLPYLFERFSQADSSSIKVHGGMGLGLALVRSLVELLGGVVTGSSQGEGKGSEFSIQFPLLQEEREDIKPSVSEGLKSVQALDQSQLDLVGVKILLVEDDDKTRMAVEQLLRSLGADVDSVSSAESAIVALGQWRVDVIVSDIAMPREDGYSLIRSIRKRGRAGGGDIPAVALTAFADVASRNEAFLAGFQAHIVKPVDAVDLVRAIVTVKNQAVSLAS